MLVAMVIYVLTMDESVQPVPVENPPSVAPANP